MLDLLRMFRAIHHSNHSSHCSSVSNRSSHLCHSSHSGCCCNHSSHSCHSGQCYNDSSHSSHSSHSCHSKHFFSSEEQRQGGQTTRVQRSQYVIFYWKGLVRCLSKRQLAIMFNCDHRTVTRRLNKGFSWYQAVNLKLIKGDNYV